MKNLIGFALLGFLLTSFLVWPANIYVVDSGLYPQYRDQLKHSGRLLQESCFSASGDSRTHRTADVNNTLYRGFFYYKAASLCKNGRAEDHGRYASTLRTTGLPGAVGRQSVSDRPVPVNTSPHQNIIANVITSNTAPGVKQWHAHDQVLVGNTNSFDELIDTAHHKLKQISSLPKTIDALRL